ncbi:MAG: hypothetical protein AAFW95_00060 [Cyanobacteria bacterium J06638_6]
MLRTSNHLTDVVYNPRRLSDRLRKLAIQFVRFSNFYGRYQSLPPAERRRFVIDRQQRLE